MNGTRNQESTRTKTCEWCGGECVRLGKESYAQFEIRRFCSKRCAALATRGWRKFSTEEERFWTKVDKSGSCWEWTARRNHLGYGQFMSRPKGEPRKLWAAHRFSWTVLRGPIPEGLYIDHICRNTSCVNPDHLEPVTNRENVLRGIGPSAINARKTHCKRGHEFTDENTRVTSKGGRECRECKRILNIEWKAKRKSVNHG